MKELENNPDLKEHFDRQRNCFYFAEYLKAYSRDNYPPDSRVFENLKDQVFNGIIDKIEEDAKNGYVRLRKVLEHATKLQLAGNPLIEEMQIMDRQGICHHLANEKKEVTWKNG